MELYDSSSVRVLLEQRDRERKKRNIIRYLSSRSFSSLLFLSRLYTRTLHQRSRFPRHPSLNRGRLNSIIDEEKIDKTTITKEQDVK